MKHRPSERPDPGPGSVAARATTVRRMIDGSTEYEIEIPVLPVSFNQTRYAHWAVVRSKNMALSDALTYYLRGSDLPKDCPAIIATAELRFPSKRRRDEGNFRTPLEKILGDVLTREGFIADDTPDQFRFERLTFLLDSGPPLTRLILRVAESN